mmetsp:Transcript_19320/g.53857  ORF Transcript_19320/g.53857 Transcript_19320/m.53857 type:complete len:581 (+) Transcript_19320:157-1899(+)
MHPHGSSAQASGVPESLGTDGKGGTSRPIQRAGSSAGGGAESHAYPRAEPPWTTPPAQAGEHAAVLLRLLRVNLNNSWSSHQRGKGLLWAFFVPATERDFHRDRSGKVKPGEPVSCMLCWCGISKRLHPNFPAGEESQEFVDVSKWLPPDLVTELGEAERYKRYTFHYKIGQSFNSLRQHLERYHAKEFALVRACTTPSAQAPGTPSTTSETIVGAKRAAELEQETTPPAPSAPVASVSATRARVEAPLAGSSGWASNSLAQQDPPPSIQPAGGSGVDALPQRPQPSAAPPSTTLYRLQRIADANRTTSHNRKTAQAQSLVGGVIVGVSSVEEARSAEEAGASAVLLHTLAEARAEGQSAAEVVPDTLADPRLVASVKGAVSVPVIVHVRVGHFVEAQVLQCAGVDYIYENESLGSADSKHHVYKHSFTVPFICSYSNFVDALTRIFEGASMIQTRVSDGTLAEAIDQNRELMQSVKSLQCMGDSEVLQFAKDNGVSLDLLHQTRALGRLPVPNFAGGGTRTPADAAMLMQMGMDGVFVEASAMGSDNSRAARLQAIIHAIKNHDDPQAVMEAICMDRAR